MFRAAIIEVELSSHQKAELSVVVEALQSQLNDVAADWNLQPGVVVLVDNPRIDADVRIFVTNSYASSVVLAAVDVGIYVDPQSSVIDDKTTLRLSATILQRFINPRNDVFVDGMHLSLISPVSGTSYDYYVGGRRVALHNYVYASFFNGGAGPYDHLRVVQDARTPIGDGVVVVYANQSIIKVDSSNLKTDVLKLRGVTTRLFESVSEELKSVQQMEKEALTEAVKALADAEEISSEHSEELEAAKVQDPPSKPSEELEAAKVQEAVSIAADIAMKKLTDEVNVKAEDLKAPSLTEAEALWAAAAVVEEPKLENLDKVPSEPPSKPVEQLKEEPTAQPEATPPKEATKAPVKPAPKAPAKQAKK